MGWRYQGGGHLRPSLYYRRTRGREITFRYHQNTRAHSRWFKLVLLMMSQYIYLFQAGLNYWVKELYTSWSSCRIYFIIAMMIKAGLSAKMGVTMLEYVFSLGFNPLSLTHSFAGNGRLDPYNRLLSVKSFHLHLLHNLPPRLRWEPHSRPVIRIP